MVFFSVSKLNCLSSRFSKHQCFQQQKETEATLPLVEVVEVKEENSAAESF